MADKADTGAARSDRPKWHTREIQRRHRQSTAKPLNTMMKAAATACELAHRQTEE